MTGLSHKKFYIFGQGISFSMSPVIHGAAFKHHSLPHTYEILQTETVDELSSLILSPDFGGASVTMPHKLLISKYCATTSSHAQKIGAVNTLIPSAPAHRSSEPRITGDNTDWSGLVSCLRSRGLGIIAEAKTGLVIGAGGASRAALYALYQLGIENIILVNRTRSKAENIASNYAPLFHVTVLSTLSEVIQKPDIIIGTIPAMETLMEYFPDSLFGKETGICVDMAYKPRETPLLKVARKKNGWVRITGVEVLLEQAFDQSELWLGLPAPKAVMISELEKADAKKEAETRVAEKLWAK